MDARDSPRRLELAKIIDEDMGIPVFPAVAQMAIAAIDRPGITAGQLSKIITRDQGLATSILRTVNSAYYQLRNEVQTVKHAVVFLGMKAVRWLIVSAVAGKLYKRHFQAGKELWRHSMGAALAARLLAEASSGNSEEAALAGLMHDVGKAVMNNAMPEMFNRSLARAGAENLQSSEAEQAVFGYTHVDVGALPRLSYGLGMTMPVMNEEWCVLASLLPDGWRELARETAAPCGVHEGRLTALTPCFSYCSCTLLLGFP